jgi:hypothetical protein
MDHNKSDNKHVSNNWAHQLTNWITEVLLNLTQGRIGEKEGENRKNIR